MRDGTRIARLDKKKNLYRKRPEDMSEAQATFDVDFHGESGIACEPALLLGERSESRENALASGEAARHQTGELAHRLKVEERMKVEYLCL